MTEHLTPVMYGISDRCYIIQILTGAEVNTEKICPKVVRCCLRTKDPMITLHSFGASILIEASSQRLFCYITKLLQ